MHLHLNTDAEQFDPSVQFYTTLFGEAPTKSRPAYAKWQLDDPKLNFVLEVLEIEGDSVGIHHLGLQVDDTAELHSLRDSIKDAGAPLLEVGHTVCCFSESEKNWTADPSGLRWETFHSYADVEEYGEKTASELSNYSG